MNPALFYLLSGGRETPSAPPLDALPTRWRPILAGPAWRPCAIRGFHDNAI
jgi:hypothetical protein